MNVQLTPAFLNKSMRKYAHLIQDVISLRFQKNVIVNPDNLRSLDQTNVSHFFLSKELDIEWANWKEQLTRFRPSHPPQGVNPGDERALYYLIRKFKPTTVLEVGTHIGASTINIAAALEQNQQEQKLTDSEHHLTTVDIIDVNDPVLCHWQRYGSQYSPQQLLECFNLGKYVTFKAQPSISFLKQTSQKFDLIFLDGSHAAQTVYKEIPLALNILNNDGVIILHDYFPQLLPLWSDGSVIPGPFLALKKLQERCKRIKVVPLGILPWQTKQNSNITSLALVLKTAEPTRSSFKTM